MDDLSVFYNELQKHENIAIEKNSPTPAPDSESIDDKVKVLLMTLSTLDSEKFANLKTLQFSLQTLNEELQQREDLKAEFVKDK